MDGIRHRERFAEIEALMDSYFRCHIAPVMSKTRTYLTEKQGEEMMEYSTSPGGILSLMASSMQPLADPYQVLKATGEWNSKTTEDYIEMCKAEIAGSEAMQQDLAYMAERWREAVVQEVGRERYDELSRELGCDLAYAFVDYRVEQLMIGRLVEERMPRSSSAQGRGRRWPASSVWTRQYRPWPRASGRRGRNPSRRSCVSARASSAATTTYSRDSAGRPPLYRRRKTRSWPKPTGGCETGYRW